MADQTEEIRLEVNPGDAVAGANKANAALDSVEKKAASASAAATKAASDFGTTIVSVTSRSQSSIERLVAAAEKRAAASGQNRIQQLAAQGNLTADRVSGDPKAVERVVAAYEKLIAVQREADREPGFVQSILQAGILLEVMQKVVGVIKDVTVGTALYAARTDQLGVALEVVARANGISLGTVRTLEKGIEKLGVTTQTTRKILTELIVAQVDVGKAKGIAELAQNVGRVSGEGTVEAFEKLKLAIVGGNERVVRSIGLNVGFQQSYEKVAGATHRVAAELGELEKIQIRTDAILAAAPSLAGVYNASLETTAGRLLSLVRATDDARNALGSKFQGELAFSLFSLEKLAIAVAKFPGLFGDMAKIALVAAGAVAAIVGGPILAGIGLAVGAVGALSFAVGKLTDFYIEAGEAIDLFFGKSAKGLEEEKKLFDSHTAMAKFKEANVEILKKVTGDNDALAKRSGEISEEQRKRSIVVEREAAQERLQALSLEAGGIRAVLLEKERSIKSKSTFLDPSGIEREFKLNAATILSINQTTQAKIALEVRKTEEQIRQERIKTAVLFIENEKHNVQSRSDLEMGNLENLLVTEKLDRRTIENERLRLHTETIDKVVAIDKKLIFDQAQEEIRKFQEDEKRKQTSAVLIQKDVEQRRLGALERIAQVDRVADDAKRKADVDLGNVRIQRDRDFADRREDFEFATTQKILEDQKRGLGQSKDLQIEQLGLIQNQSIAFKLATEQAKLGIEVDYLKRANAIEKLLLEQRFQRDTDKINEEGSRLGISHEEINRKLLDLDKRYQLDRGQLSKDTDAGIILAQTRSAVQQSETLQNHYRSVYDSIKQSAGGVFDQLFTKSQNIFQAIGNVFKTAMLTALKEVVTSKIAAALTQMLTGAKVSLASAGLPGEGGTLAKLGNVLGIGTPVFSGGKIPKLELPNHIGDVQLINKAIPVYISGTTLPQQAAAASSGGSGATGIAAGAALGLGLAGLAGASTPGSGPSGTFSKIMYDSGGAIIAQPTFAGGTAGTVGSAIPGSAGVALGPESAGGSASILSGFAGFGKSITGALKSLGNLGTGKVIPGAGSTGAAQSIRGVGGVTGGLMLAGGGILAADGLRRGGIAGLAETTAGGALIGAKFGGPVGALIGAGIGALAGTIRLFIKGAETKLIQKVQDLYGVKIDKQMAQQILATAKSSFGGNTDLAIRSPQIRDLLQLYAETTGQKFGGAAARAQSLSLIQGGGQLFQSPNFQNGSALPSLGGSIPSLGLSGAGQQSAGAQPYAIQITATDQQVSDFMTTKTLNIVASNPRAISAASLGGARTNTARRELSAVTTEPGLLVS